MTNNVIKIYGGVLGKDNLVPEKQQNKDVVVNKLNSLAEFDFRLDIFYEKIAPDNVENLPYEEFKYVYPTGHELVFHCFGKNNFNLLEFSTDPACLNVTRRFVSSGVISTHVILVNSNVDTFIVEGECVFINVEKLKTYTVRNSIVATTKTQDIACPITVSSIHDSKLIDCGFNSHNMRSDGVRDSMLWRCQFHGEISVNEVRAAKANIYCTEDSQINNVTLNRVRFDTARLSIFFSHPFALKDITLETENIDITHPLMLGVLKTGPLVTKVHTVLPLKDKGVNTLRVHFRNMLKCEDVSIDIALVEEEPKEQCDGLLRPGFYYRENNIDSDAKARTMLTEAASALLPSVGNGGTGEMCKSMISEAVNFVIGRREIIRHLIDHEVADAVIE